MLDAIFADWNATTTILLITAIGLGWELTDILNELKMMKQALFDIKENTRS